jgi:farnesyl-diphosphate farnesyltransferase
VSSIHPLGEGPDVRVCQGLDQVLTLMETFPPQVVASLRTWVGEMTRGMALYASRRARVEGRVVLRDVGDLDRYCYFVAGTVGHLLTDLFCLGSPRLESSREELTRHAEGFALLLQLTNIVKDVAEDWERGFCFLPSSVLASEGIPKEALLDEAYHSAAQCAVETLVDLARSQASSALAYVQALAPEEIGPRRFCLFPMLLALRTLDLAQGNPAVLKPGVPVKVGREVVGEILLEMESLLADESALAAFDPGRRIVREVV